MSDHDFESSTSERERNPDVFYSGTDFRGPILDHQDDNLNNHIALIYETQEQQFAVATRFVREGLERDECCLYIVDDNTEADVLAALRDDGIDVDAALDSDALCIQTKADSSGAKTYDPDDMIDFLDDSLREATDQEDYEGLRIAGEMTWALGDGNCTDRLIEYEALLNEYFPGRDCIALCQYNRERFSSEVLVDVISNHPYLAQNGTVANNIYHLPLDTFFGNGHSQHDAATKVETVLERLQAKNTLTNRERGLNALNDITRELMQAAPGDITNRVTDIAKVVLDVEFTSFWQYNEDIGELEQHSSSTGSQTDPDDVSFPEGYEDRAWQTFVRSVNDIDNDVQPVPSLSESEMPIRSDAILPLGRYGVLYAGSSHKNVFNDATIDLAETVATNVEAALDRAAREQKLEHQNSQLNRLNRINSVIRAIDQALVQADTREEIDRVVCEQLVDSESYELAWIGEYDGVNNTINPREWAGNEDDYLEAITITTDNAPTGQGPVSTAMRTQDVQVVQDVIIDSTFEPWRDETLERGFRSCISIPLAYEESLYGVLNVYSGRPNIFHEMDQTVLRELGETIAHAIDGVETKQSLHTDSIVELELRLHNPASVLCRLARQAECRIDFQGLVPQADGSPRLFFTACGTEPKRILAAADQSPAVDDLTCITQGDDESLFETMITGQTLASHLTERGAKIRTFTTDGETSTVVVNLPATTKIRDFIENVQASYPETEIVGRHNRDRPIQTSHELQAALEDRLTDRQREVLQTAYLSGFFESPRVRTGTEVTESLGIAQATFTEHLRTAERKVFELLFDEY